MKVMIHRCHWMAILLLAAPSGGWARFEVSEGQIRAALAGASASHPRLLWPANQQDRVRARIQGDPLLAQAADLTITQARDMLTLPPLQRIQTGRRLLGVSREFLQRMTYWATAYRLTGDHAFLTRAEQEMLTVAGFADWNPSHFLDVAEMTLGVAIGYDWLYTDLSESTRIVLKRAILDLGVRPSLDGPGGGYNGWDRAVNNWNQVCHAGMMLGALAVLEDEPELAQKVVSRAVNHVQIAMDEYAPDGGYPEGPGYWVYGTSFNVVLLDGLKTVLGTDFGLSDLQGFARTPWYYVHMVGPGGSYFNYSDCGLNAGYTVALAWFAGQAQAPALQAYDRQSLREHIGRRSKERLFPLALLWSTPGQGTDLGAGDWRSDGATPVVTHRSAWQDPRALYLGVKAGSPGANHAHMDIGSFVLEADGVRWAVDLGAQNYNSLESKGLDIWNRNQSSDRWRVFRYTNAAHSTLVIQGQPQRVKGFAPIRAHEAQAEQGFAVVDLQPVYADQIDAGLRGFKWLRNGQVLIQDDVKVTRSGGAIRWAMVTPAQITMDRSRAVLTHAGETLILDTLSPAGVRWQVTSAEPPEDYDAANEGISLIGFEVPVDAQQMQSLAVLITPGSKKKAAEKKVVLLPIEEW